MEVTWKSAHALRQKAGLTRRQFADLAQVSVEDVQAWEDWRAAPSRSTWTLVRIKLAWRWRQFNVAAQLLEADNPDMSKAFENHAQ